MSREEDAPQDPHEGMGRHRSQQDQEDRSPQAVQDQEMQRMRGAPQGVRGSPRYDRHYVRCIQDNEVVCFAQHYSVVMTTYLQFKERLKANDQSLTDFAKSIPFAVSDLEFIPQNNDLVMSGPFAEPDSYFISRQAKPYSSEDEYLYV